MTCLQGLRRHRLNPCVRDFEVTVGVQEDLDGGWRLGAVLQNLEAITTLSRSGKIHAII